MRTVLAHFPCDGDDDRTSRVALSSSRETFEIGELTVRPTESGRYAVDTASENVSETERHAAVMDIDNMLLIASDNGARRQDDLVDGFQAWSGEQVG